MDRPVGGARAGVPALHVVTDDAVLARADFPALAAEVLGLGPDVALHVRGRRAAGGFLHGLAERLGGVAASGAFLVVNDRVDVALAAGVRRVHLGEGSLPVGLARALMGPGAEVGVSAHSAEGAARASREGARWIFAGTIYATASHADVEPCGPAGLSAAVEAAADVPVLAIGGVTPGRVAEVVEMGAHGAAVIGGVWRARDPVAAANEYLETLARESR